MGMLFAGVPVANFTSASAWYERLFGRPPDVIPSPGSEVMWQVAETGWVYVVVDPERAGNALVTVAVADLEAHVGELAGRGLAVGPIEEQAPGAFKAEIADPDGNRIGFAQVPSGA
jgi:predicted enzyme related to lactoylglutathione lyase